MDSTLVYLLYFLLYFLSFLPFWLWCVAGGALGTFFAWLFIQWAKRALS